MNKPDDVNRSPASHCYRTFTLEEDLELQAAIDAWIPYWRRPKSQEEWDKLVKQRETFAASAIETHREAIESGMPQWFIQLSARSRYQAIRRYIRTKRRADILRKWPSLSPEERLLATIKFDL